MGEPSSMTLLCFRPSYYSASHDIGVLALDLCTLRWCDFDGYHTRRCPLVKYINVSETMVHHTVFPIIAAVWQYSMINISLPERFSRELRLYTDYGPYGRREEFRKSVMTMPKLEYLHIGHYSFHPSDIMFRRDTVRMLSQMFDKKFPTLNINYNPFSTQGPSQSDPNRKFRNIVTPEGWEWRG